MHPASRLLVAVALLSTLACAGGSPERRASAREPAEAPPGARPDRGTGLRPAQDQVVQCFDWPDREFSRANRATRGEFLHAGDRAVDFTLDDVAGRPVRLGALLEERPVLLVQGSHTCPVFQERLPGLRATAERYEGQIHALVVYNIEAHPKAEPSPYRGVPTEHEYSDRGQPRSYAERAANARTVDAGKARVLVDALDGRASNPVWCTYGTCPACAWLIRQDGVIETLHDWYDPTSMDASIAALLQRG
jgi:hypothetical protein